MIGFRQKGDFSKTAKYFKKLRSNNIYKALEKYANQGVKALASATPVKTGLTARSWYHKIEVKEDSATIVFCNSNIQNGIPIAIILQYGHGTNNGGYVQGRDYINPALQPVFDKLVNEAWGEVTKL